MAYNQYVGTLFFLIISMGILLFSYLGEQIKSVLFVVIVVFIYFLYFPFITS